LFHRVYVLHAIRVNHILSTSF